MSRSARGMISGAVAGCGGGISNCAPLGGMLDTIIDNEQSVQCWQPPAPQHSFALAEG